MRQRTKPFAHQAQEIERLDEGRALFWEPGVGKSLPMLYLADRLYDEDRIRGAVIVAPNGVHQNWIEREAPRHLDLEDVSLHAWSGPRARTKAHAARFRAHLLHPGLSILAISYDSLLTDPGWDAARAFLSSRPSLLVLDESHRIKNARSKRSKRALAASRLASFRRILTGTPVGNAAFDLYAQIKAVRPDVLERHGLKTSAAFRSTFGIFRQVRYGAGRPFMQLVRYRNLDLLRGIVDEIGTRLKKEDVLDLPPKLYQLRPFELSAPQARAYREMRDEFRTWLEGGERVTAALAVVRMTRLQQITSGYVPDDDEDRLRDVGEDRPRIRALEELLEDIGEEPAIIWAKYDRDVDQIRDLLGDRAVYYDGRTPDDLRGAALDAFQAKRQVQFFVGKPSAAGTGLTLHRAKVVIYYNTSFDPLLRFQSEDRAHRAGMPDGAVTYYDLVATIRGDETIDHGVLKKIDEHRKLAADLVGDPEIDWVGLTY